MLSMSNYKIMKNSTTVHVWFSASKIWCTWLTVLLWCSKAEGANVLMVTMGGTKSHTVPFVALSRALSARGHNMTLLSGFPGAAADAWAEEVSPPGLVNYIHDYTEHWDLLGRRFKGEPPISPLDALRYGTEVCTALLEDDQFLELVHAERHFDLVVLDGAYSECALGLVHHYDAPFMYINTVGLYTAALAVAGNPEPFATTPFFNSAFTDDMNILQRLGNAVLHLTCQAMHYFAVHMVIQPALKNTFGTGMPSVLEMQRNVSFVLQNGHPSLTYARAYLPNVAEVACLHCHAPRPLSQDLEDFIVGAGSRGVVVVSMGSSVRAAAMPASLRRIFVLALGRLPQRVLWKWEQGSGSPNVSLPATTFLKNASLSIFPEELPPNIKLVNWLPQQDLLGHQGVVALVSHGGLLSMFETAYHGKPMVTLPVFCDHDANAAKAEADGYAIRLELRGLTAEALESAITRVLHDPRYRESAVHHSRLLLDQPDPPLQRAVFWTEHVLRHRGAPHLQGSSRHLGLVQWLYLDVLLLLTSVVCLALEAVHLLAMTLKRPRVPGKMKQQ